MQGRIQWILLTMVAIVCLTVTGCMPATPAQPAAPAQSAAPAQPAAAKLPAEIVVGALEPLTGAHAVFGTEAKQGMELAVDHINAAGGIKSLNGLKLKLVSEDAGENADSAKLGAESLISKHHPVAILGLYISRMTIAASEVTEREKVILIADALVDSVTSLGRRYLFRPAPKASQHGASAVQFVTSEAKKAGLNFSKVAILNEDSSFGRSNATGAMNEALNQGLTIVYQKEYPFDITDASSIVADVAKSGADFVVHCPYFTDAILFAKTFRETGNIPQFVAGMGASGYTDPESIKALGDTSEYYSNTYSYNPPVIPTPTPTPTPEETITPETPPLGPTPNPEETINPDDTPLDPSPKTGDSSNVALMWLLFCASFSGLVVLGATAPKKRREDR